MVTLEKLQSDWENSIMRFYFVKKYNEYILYFCENAEINNGHIYTIPFDNSVRWEFSQSIEKLFPYIIENFEFAFISVKSPKTK